jgi:hypothetical protein
MVVWIYSNAAASWDRLGAWDTEQQARRVIGTLAAIGQRAVAVSAETTDQASIDRAYTATTEVPA